MNPGPLIPPENFPNKSKKQNQFDKSNMQMQIEPPDPPEIITQQRENDDYSLYANLGIEFKLIKPINGHTFYISVPKCQIIASLILAFFLAIFSVLCLTEILKPKDDYHYALGLFLGIADIIIFIVVPFLYKSIKFTLGENDITIEKQRCLMKSVTNYKPGQLINLKISTEILRECGSNAIYKYEIFLTLNENGASSPICQFSDSARKPIYTAEEIMYFNDIMFYHIRSRMMVSK